MPKLFAKAKTLRRLGRRPTRGARHRRYNRYVIPTHGARGSALSGLQADKVFSSSMAQPLKLEVSGVHALPPLILHPFTESASTVQLLETARTSLSALREKPESSEEHADLKKQLLEGRYAEVRMLFYVGKDIFRWLDQCVDVCERSPELIGNGITHQSFGHLLIKQTPPDVAAKLRSWGVIEYARIFSRAIGIHTQFREAPPRSLLHDDYLRHYYRFADYAFACWKDIKRAPLLMEEQFPFTLYASGEYAKMLEQQWGEAR